MNTNIDRLFKEAEQAIRELETKVRTLECTSSELDIVLEQLKGNNKGPPDCDHKNAVVGSNFQKEMLPQRGFISNSPDFDGIVKSFHSQANHITCDKLPLDPEKALGYLFHSVMHPNEMQSIMDFCVDHSDDMIPASRRVSIRNCDRMEIESEAFATFLWERLRKSGHDVFSGTIDDASERCFDTPGSDLEGTWEPYGLNSLIRVIRYPHGGHFAPHYDSHYCFSQDDRTLLTCMMYLTDEFDCGETAFLSESSLLTSETNDKPVLSEAITVQVKPKAGSCIVFSHHLLHQGNITRPLLSECSARPSLNSRWKWILRTEVCFKRIVRPQRSPSHTRALELLEQARVAENNQDYEVAQKLYRSAFKLHPELNLIIK